MRVHVKHTCRGAGKIFTLFEVEGLDAAHTLMPEYPHLGDVEIPFLVDELVELDPEPGVRRFVGTFPNLTVTSCTFTLLAADAEAAHRAGAAGAATLPADARHGSFAYKLRFEVAKWESRLNYRTKPEACKQIRDFDCIGAHERACIEFWQAIPDVDAYIVRGAVYTPPVADARLQLRIVDEHGHAIPVDPINMGVGTEEVGCCPGRERRAERFSVRLPKEICRYFFDARDERHPELASFEALDDAHLQTMVEDAEEEMLSAQFDPHYSSWFDLHRANRGDIALQASTRLAHEPVFSIVVPLYKTPPACFRAAVDSVRSQSYANWELVLVNASPEDAELCALCESAASKDARIKLIVMGRNEGISLNTRAGIEAATGEFLCFMDHDDAIEPDALFCYARAVNKHPDADLLYCDEDKIDENGAFVQPFFKPDLSIDLLRHVNYICHMLCLRRSLYDTLVPPTPEFDGAQDHDLTLQAVEFARRVVHIPRILYHWRIGEGSTAASGEVKTYAIEAGVRAVQNHLDRQGIAAHVSASARPFTYRVDYAVPEDEPLVSIIIPSKDHVDVLDACVQSILDRSTYSNYELVIIENNSTEPETFAYYERLVAAHGERVRVERWPAEFNFSKLMNFGAQKAKGDYLLLLNNDTEVITPGWIEGMLGICARPDVGIVGVRLLYPDGIVQHAGVMVGGGNAAHIGLNLPRSAPGYQALQEAPQDFSAVTAACLMTKRSAFESVGGFTEEFAVDFNDVDFCLKVRKLGLLVVYTPYVELYHYESLSRGRHNSPEKQERFMRELSLLRLRWADHYAAGDPYYPATFDQSNTFYNLATDL